MSSNAKLPGEGGIEIRHSVCPVCDRGCGLDVYIRDGVPVKIEGTKAHPTGKGFTCARGISARGYVMRPDRLLYPLRRVGERGEGKFERIGWDEAYAEIARRLNGVKDTLGARSVSFFGGHTKWYRAFLQRLVYSFGSPNYGTESSCCFTHSYMAWKTFAGDNSKPDMAHAGVFLGWGFNPYVDPRGAAAAEKFKSRGGRLIVVDYLRTQCADKLADIFLQPKPGTDLALALGIGNILIKNGWIDRDYIDRYVYGFDAYAAACAEIGERELEELTGVPYADAYRAAEMMHDNLPLAVNKVNGHHINGYQTNRALFSLLALTGCYDREGGNKPAPFAYLHQGESYRLLDREFVNERRFKVQGEPVGAQRFPLWYRMENEQQAMDLSRQITEGTPYPIRALVGFGMNYRMFPDPEFMKAAINKLDFFVDVDLFMTDTARLADIVLPAQSTFERHDLKTYPGAMWYHSPVMPPLGETRSDAQIICELAAALGLDDELLRSGPEACWTQMLRSVKFELSDISGDAPVKLPDAKPWVPGEKLKTGLNTPTRKLELSSTLIEDHPEWGLDPVPRWYPPLDVADPVKYPLVLVTGIRLPNSFHSRLRGVEWEDVVRGETLAEISHADADALGVAPGDRVEVFTPRGSITLAALPSERVQRGCVHIYHGDPAADANTLLDRDHLDPYDGFPAFRSTRCGMRKAGAK